MIIGRRAALAIGLLYFTGAVLWHLSHRGWFVDFKVYLEAARKAHAGLTVYDVLTIDQFKYAPWVATCMGGLLDGLRFESAAPLFATFMAALWLACGREVARMNQAWGGALLCFYSHCLATDLVMGQINALTLSLLLLGYRGLEKNRPAQTGIAWGLALQIKLYAAFAFPLLLFRRDWKALAWAAFCFIACNFGWVTLIHGWTYAFSEFESWLRTLTTSTTDLLLNRDNISLLGVVGKWVLRIGWNGRWIAWSAWSIGCAAFLGGAWSRRKAPASFHAAWSMLGILVLNPLAWSYWLYFTAPALMIGLQYLVRTQSRVAAILLALGALQLLTFLDQALVHRGGGILLAGVCGVLLLREFKVNSDPRSSSTALEPSYDETVRA